MEITIGKISFKVCEDCFPKGVKKYFNDLWVKVYWKRVKKGLWEPQTFKIFKNFLDTKHSYIDIGAWIGPTVLYGCQLAQHCYAVEPDPVALKKLRENINLNSQLKEKISIHETCITNKNGNISLGNVRNSFGNSMSGILFKDSRKSVRVKSIRLEDFIKRNKIDNLNFIKMDIEGGEIIVLPDIKDYLKKNKPTIHLSLHPFWFKNLKEDSKKIISVLKIYKNSFDNKGKKLTLKGIYSDLIKEKEFDIVATDKEWK